MGELKWGGSEEAVDEAVRLSRGRFPEVLLGSDLLYDPGHWAIF